MSLCVSSKIDLHEGEHLGPLTGGVFGCAENVRSVVKSLFRLCMSAQNTSVRFAEWVEDSSPRGSEQERVDWVGFGVQEAMHRREYFACRGPVWHHAMMHSKLAKPTK